jgi:uncharacterized protein (TIRG00374 family)
VNQATNKGPSRAQTSAGSGSNKRAMFMITAKISVAVALLWLLMSRVDIAVLREMLVTCSKPLFLAGIVLIGCTVLIAGLRWMILVRATGLHLRWRDLTSIAIIGQFFATFLPGPLGDDLTRMVYITRIAGDKAPLAISSVVIDRLIGLSVILLLALFVMPWHSKLLFANAQTATFAGALIAGGLFILTCLCLFFAVPRHWLHRVGSALMQRVPAGRWRMLSGRFAGAYLDRRRALARVLIIAFLVQVILCAVYWVAGMAVGIEVGPGLWFGFVPVVLAAHAIPVTIAGLGIREYLVVLFLGVLGDVPPEPAMAASLIVLGMTLSINMLGGLVFLLYRFRSTNAGGNRS